MREPWTDIRIREQKQTDGPTLRRRARPSSLMKPRSSSTSGPATQGSSTTRPRGASRARQPRSKPDRISRTLRRAFQTLLRSARSLPEPRINLIECSDKSVSKFGNSLSGLPDGCVIETDRRRGSTGTGLSWPPVAHKCSIHAQWRCGVTSTRACPDDMGDAHAPSLPPSFLRANLGVSNLRPD